MNNWIQRTFFVGACLVFISPMGLAAQARRIPHVSPQSLVFKWVSKGSVITLEKAPIKMARGVTIYRLLDSRGKSIAMFLVGPKWKVANLTHQNKVVTPQPGGVTTQALGLSGVVTSSTASCACKVHSSAVLGTPLTVITITASDGTVISVFIYNSGTGKITVLKAR